MTSGTPEQVLTDERLDSLESRLDKVEQWQRDAVPKGDHVRSAGTGTPTYTKEAA